MCIWVISLPINQLSLPRVSQQWPPTEEHPFQLLDLPLFSPCKQRKVGTSSDGFKFQGEKLSGRGPWLGPMCRITRCKPGCWVPTQGSNQGLRHCRWILNHLSQKGSPRILEWVAYLFSRGIFSTQGSNPRLLHLLHWQIGRAHV